MGSSGNFKSFNFGLNDDDYHQLATQEYSICIRRAAGRCKISYQAANEGESFYTSQTPSTPAVRSKAGERGCRADYITIPNGSGSLSGGAMCQVSPMVELVYNVKMIILFRVTTLHHPTWTVSADFVGED